MNTLIVQLNLNTNLYLKDPKETKLGKKIIEHSVLLIDEIGLEQFTFKKLAKIIPSSEASIYRYFENKHQLFVYLLNWYWEWMIVRIKWNTLNIKNPIEKFKLILSIIVDTANRNMDVEFIDEEILHKIVVREGSKAYHHKSVDEDNAEGFFLAYKRLCGIIAENILEINPDFTYPKALASTLVETANNNIYFARHLPRLTDLKGKKSKTKLEDQVKEMLFLFAFGILNAAPESIQTPGNNTN